MSALTPFVIPDERAAYVNEARQQFGTFWLEYGVVAQNDTIEYTMDRLDAEENAQVPIQVSIFTHNGGLTNTVNDAWAVSDGDTIIYEVNIPESDEREIKKESKGTTFRKFTHTLDGVTGGAATKNEVVASLMADTTFIKYAYAAFDSVTAERVTLYPKTPLGKIRVVGGTAQDVLIFPATTVENNNRTYTHAPIVAADWSWTFVRSTKKLTITRVHANTAKNVAVYVRMF